MIIFDVIASFYRKTVLIAEDASSFHVQCNAYGAIGTARYLHVYATLRNLYAQVETLWSHIYTHTHTQFTTEYLLKWSQCKLTFTIVRVFLFENRRY